MAPLRGCTLTGRPKFKVNASVILLNSRTISKTCSQNEWLPGSRWQNLEVFLQPCPNSLRWLIGLWGLLRPHTFCRLSNQWAQVKPASATNTQGDLLHGNMEHLRHVSFSAKLRINRFNTASSCVLCFGGAQKSHFSGRAWHALS